MEEWMGAVENFGLVGAIVIIIKLVIQARPITLLTSHPIELKLNDKDTQYYVKLIKTIGEVLFLSFGMLVIAFGVSQIGVHNERIPRLLSYFYIMIFVVSILWSLFYLAIKKKTPAYIKKYRRTSLSVFICYVLFLMYIPPIGVGISLSNELKVIYDHLDQVLNKQVFGQLFPAIAFLMLFFIIISFCVLFSCKLTSRVFEIDRSRERSLYIKIGHEEWFLQNYFRKKYIYLTDNPSVDKSTRIRFAKSDEIFEKTIYIKQQNMNDDMDQSNAE